MTEPPTPKKTFGSVRTSAKVAAAVSIVASKPVRTSTKSAASIAIVPEVTKPLVVRFSVV